MKMKTFVAVVAAMGALAVRAGAEVKFVPLVDVGLMGGQSFYDGRSSAFSGNFNLDLVPAVRVGERLSVLPRYSGAYVGSSLAMEIEDENYLYQDVQDHTFALQLVRKGDGGNRIRLSGGYMVEMLRETRDEEWGDGLYDFTSPFGEVELVLGLSPERGLSQAGAALRHYRMRFPNYESLASQRGLDLMGQEVVDSSNTRFSVFADFRAGENSVVQVRVAHEQSSYRDQRIISDTGDYSADRREDRTPEVGIELRQGWPGREPGVFGQVVNTYLHLGAGLKFKRSNQNFYDPEVFTFIGEYYDYNRVELTPTLTFTTAPADVDLSIGYRYSSKAYPNRLTQDADGYYQDEKLKVTMHEGNAAVGYEYAKGLRFSVSGAYQSVGSTTDYHRLYSYSYKTAHAMFGVTYEY